MSPKVARLGNVVRIAALVLTVGLMSGTPALARGHGGHGGGHGRHGGFHGRAGYHRSGRSFYGHSRYSHHGRRGYGYGSSFPVYVSPYNGLIPPSLRSPFAPGGGFMR